MWKVLLQTSSTICEGMGALSVLEVQEHPILKCRPTNCETKILVTLGPLMQLYEMSFTPPVRIHDQPIFIV